MGLVTYAIASSFRSARRCAARSSAASAARERERYRAFQRSVTEPMFYSPTLVQVLHYLIMKEDAARSPERAAAYRLQIDAIRAGARYTVSANPDTGSVRVRILR